MSNVPPLTRYMLSDRWNVELNTENPLGMQGDIATTYANLIQTMWSGKHGCAVPRQFKVNISSLNDVVSVKGLLLEALMLSLIEKQS
jgi:ubiquitin C-terminal hydrolase